jgi:hypothetical protein
MKIIDVLSYIFKHGPLTGAGNTDKQGLVQMPSMDFRGIGGGSDNRRSFVQPGETGGS